MPFTFPSVYESIVKEENINDGGSVQMEWNDTESTFLPIGTACPIDSNYILFADYYPSQSSVGNYHYSVKFLHRLAQLDYLPFYFKTRAVTGVEDGQVQSEEIILSTYPYTGNIQTIATALADSLTEHAELGEWTADTGSLSASITMSISFDGATIKSAASAIADAFGVDYWFDWATHTIRFGTLGTSGNLPSDSVVTADANGITEGVAALISASDGEVQYNVFRILGGTRNMSKKNIQGKNIQVTQRLMLDDGDGVTDSIIDTRAAGSTLPKIMKDLVFDDIYPKMELWLYDVKERRCWLTDENGQKIVDSETINPETGGTVTTYKTYSKWYFKLARWNGTELVPYIFDTELIIQGMTLSMVFQPNYEEGALPQPLIGREFELTFFGSPNPAREKEADDIDPNGYQPEQGEFRIIFKVDGDMILPSTSDEGIRPYSLSENNMPVLSKLSNKVTLTNVAMDDDYMEAAKAELKKAADDAILAYAKDKRSFTYTTYGNAPALGGNISSVRTDLITGEVQFTVGDYQSSKGLIGRLSDKIDSATSGGGGAAVNDSESTPRGGGVSELSIPILSRLMGSGNVVKDTLTILKELILGTNGHKIEIDMNGDASMTIGSLTVLGATHLNEIDINHIRHTGGMMVVTKANIIVDSYEILDGGLWRLYFRRMDGNGQAIVNLFEVGDFALMMTFNEDLDGSINRYYWREVVAVGNKTETVVNEDTHETEVVDTDLGYITVNYGTFNALPKEGDVVVQLGNRSDTTRQGATVLGGSGPNGGFMAIYDGFNIIPNTAPSLDNYGNALIYLSPKKNKITGDFLSESGDNLDNKLTEISGIINSIKQQSDKQLVIWYGDSVHPLPNSSDLEHWNTPAKDWHDADVLAGNTEQQALHVEDIFYIRRDNTPTGVGGRAWQWIHDAVRDDYHWVEITDAYTIAALEAADTAVEAANDAQAAVANLASDGIISAGSEKSDLLMAWQDTVAEYVKLEEQARDYDLDDENDVYENAQLSSRSPYHEYCYRYRELAVMLNNGSETNIESIMAGTVSLPDTSMIPEWLQDLTEDVILANVTIANVALTPDQYRETWNGYYESRSALLKAIADAARGRIEDIESDGVISAGSEKTALYKDWLEAVAEYKKYIAQAEDYHLEEDSANDSPYSVYVSAYAALALMLNDNDSTNIAAVKAGTAVPLWLELSGNTYLKEEGSNEHPTPSDYRNTWDDYYNAKAALLKTIEKSALSMTEDAQATADEALSRLDDIVADGKLTSDELPTLKREFESAYRERAKMTDLATDDTTNKLIDAVLRALLDGFLAAFKNLTTYMQMGTGAWTEPTDATNHTYGYNVSNGSNVTDANASYDVVAKVPLGESDFPLLLHPASGGAIIFQADWLNPTTNGDNGAQFRNLWAALKERQTSLANAMATLAKDSADEAQEAADAAQNDVNRLADDGIISGGWEKSKLLMEWRKVVSEYTTYTSLAEDYGIDDESPYLTFANAYREVVKMLNGGINPTTDMMGGTTLPAWLQTLNEDTVLSDYDTMYNSTVTKLTATIYRNRWNAYNSALTNLLNAIETKAKELTEAAQADATEALNAIAGIAADGELSTTEIPDLKREFETAYRQRGEMVDLATFDYPQGSANNYKLVDLDLFAPLNTYLTAFKAIANYLNKQGGSNGSGGTYGVWIEPSTYDVSSSSPSTATYQVATKSPLSNGDFPTLLKSTDNVEFLSDWSNTSSKDGGAKFRDLWADLEKKRIALSNAMATIANTKADDANSLLADMASDSKLDPAEKETVRREFISAWRERGSANSGGLLDKSTDAYGNFISIAIQTAYDSYNTAFCAVGTYLNGSNGTWYSQNDQGPAYSTSDVNTKIPLWLHSARANQTEPIDGGVWRNLWSDFYSKRTALMTALSEDAKSRADNAQTTANNKKRIFTTSPNQLPPAPYDVDDLWVNAVWNSSGSSWSANDPTYSGDTLICVHGRAETVTDQRSISDWADAVTGVTAKIANLGNRIDLEVQNRKSGTSSMLTLNATGGNLSAQVYNAQTDTWTPLVTIGAALEYDNENHRYTGKLNLLASNTVISSDLISVIASNINIQADQLDFAGGSLKIDAVNIDFTGSNYTIDASNINFAGVNFSIDASNINFTTVGTRLNLQDGVVRLMMDNLGGVTGHLAPSGLESNNWQANPLNASTNYPHVWVRETVYENRTLISTTYILIKKPTDSGKGYSAQFASSSSPAQTQIHNEFVTGDYYMRLKKDGDANWGEWFLVVGENYDENGNAKRYNFNRSTEDTLPNETQALQEQLGMVVMKEGDGVGEFSFGTYINGVFNHGLRFRTDSGTSKLVLAADTTIVNGDFKVSAATNINFQGEEIELTGSTLSFVGGTVDFSGTTIQFGANQFEIDTDNLVIDASKVLVGTGGSTATLRDGLVSLLLNQVGSGTNKEDIQKSLGMVIRKEGTVNDTYTFAFGSFVNGNFVAGLQFKEETVSGVTTRKLLLSADTTEVDSDFMMVNAGNINFEGEEINISSGRSLTFKGNGTIDFRGTTVRLNANDIQVIADSGVSVDVSQVTFNSGGVAATLEDGLVSLFMTQLDSNNTPSFQQQLGMVIRQSGTNNEFSFGSYVNGTFRAGLQFKLVNNNQTKLMLTADNVDISTDLFTLISSQITVSASNLDIEAEQINFTTGGFKVGGTPTEPFFAIDANGRVTLRDLTVLGNSTFHGSVSGTITSDIDLYHNVCVVSSGGRHYVGNADIVMIGGFTYNASEDVVIVLPDPSLRSGKLITIYGAQNPSYFGSHTVKLASDGTLPNGGSQYRIITAWGTECIRINESTNRLNSTNEMVLRSDGTEWRVLRWTEASTNNGSTYVLDIISGLA